MQARRKLIVVSNRGPIGYVREGGERIARRGAGGLVTALAPLVSHHDVTWIASALSDEDRVVAAEGPVEATAPDGSRYRLRLVAHDPVAYDLYYHVVANPALWFVQHGLWELKHEPERDLRPAWEEGYASVNAGIRRRSRRGAGPRPGHGRLLPRLPPVPGAEVRARAAARRGDRALHAHSVGRAGRLVGAAGRDRQGDPREPALLRRRQLPHESLAGGVPVDVRRSWASTRATRS